MESFISKAATCNLSENELHQKNCPKKKKFS